MQWGQPLSAGRQFLPGGSVQADMHTGQPKASEQAFVSKRTAEVGVAEPATNVENKPGEDEHTNAQPDPPICKQSLQCQVAIMH